MPRSLALVPLLLLALCEPVTAQDAEPERATSQATGQSTVANVNGEPITSTDVMHQARMLSGQDVTSLDAASAQEIRRQLAEQMLMAGEATRLGVTVNEAYVDDFWKSYRGGKPDYEAMAAASGTTVERQKELAKRSVLADLYVYHRVGIWAEFGHLIKPDAFMAHLVEVSPKELRDLFRAERAKFDLPATVSYDFYPCSDEAQALGVAQALGAQLVPTGVRPGRETAPMPLVPEVFAFSSELVEFLLNADVGSVSPPFDAEMGWIVFEIAERTDARPAQFAEVQEELRRRMRISRLEGARRQLVAELMRNAVFWPRELFTPSPQSLSAGDR